MNNKMNKILQVLFSFFAICLLSACMSVKEYQKMYLNDKDMVLALNKLENYETSFEAYREGASGASGGNIGGGCGCN
jgi:hypothetical protein